VETDDRPEHQDDQNSVEDNYEGHGISFHLGCPRFSHGSKIDLRSGYDACKSGACPRGLAEPAPRGFWDVCAAIGDFSPKSPCGE
jgi:hypothetical protein